MLDRLTRHWLLHWRYLLGLSLLELHGILLRYLLSRLTRHRLLRGLRLQKGLGRLRRCIAGIL